jgi:hypothetical protein
MKSRTILPAAILATGFRVLTIVNRGIYAFQKAKSTLIKHPPRKVVIDIDDLTPPAILALLPTNRSAIDEQGLLSLCRYNDLFSVFLNARVLHFKSHVRRSVAGIGQVEIDDVHVALVPADTSEIADTIVPVEAKAKADPINRAQIAAQIHYARQEFPTLAVRPVVVKMLDDGIVLFIEFNASADAAGLKSERWAYYRFT